MHKRFSGFTIIELLVVIVVIAIIAAVTIVAYAGIQSRAVVTTLKSDLSNAATQLDLDKALHEKYPDDMGAANESKGLNMSSGVDFQYTASDGGFCLTAVSDKKGIPTFMISSSDKTPREGICPGHAVFTENEGYVTTFAGGASSGFVNGPVADARFSWPYGIVMDTQNNIYVADGNNNSIRKISSDGIVTTLAGSGAQGMRSGSSAYAEFRSPRGLAIDSAGNLYVADSNNYCIRKVTPAGYVTNFASCPYNSNGWATSGYVDATGSSARFGSVTGITITPSGDLYVVDGQRIRKITPGAVVTTFAGSGVKGNLDGQGTAAQFNNPSGITVTPSGNFYVTDVGSHRIRKITPDGMVTTFAGSTAGVVDGQGTAARFYSPRDIASDKNGVLYVANSTLGHIRKITPDGMVTTFAGSAEGYADGPGASARFSTPYGIMVDRSGAIYVTEGAGGRIRKIR